MEYETIKNFFIVLLAICGAILTMGGAINLLLNWSKQSKVSQHERIINDHENRLKDLEKNKKETEGFAKVMCNSMLALLNHNINGNSKDKLEEAKKELQDYLISK